MRTIRKFVPDVLLVGGLGVVLTGIYVLAGVGFSLVVGGCLLAAGGVLLELGWFSGER